MSSTDDLPSALSEDRKFVTALARGLDILRAYRPGDTLLGNRDLAERTGLAKATVSRLTYTLTQLGYLRLDAAAGRYALDAGILALGFAFLANCDILELARPHMRAFAREAGVAVSLGCRDGDEVVYLETIRSETALSLGLATGSRLSMLTSSMGRAYLAIQPAAERAALLARLGRGAGADAAALGVAARQAVAAFARDGCCYSMRDWHPDVNAVAVPFRDPRQDRWLMLTASGPAASMAPAMFTEHIGPRLRTLAAHLGPIAEPTRAPQPGRLSEGGAHLP
jgi:DNA-binding IclR family transcriptional regulator